MGSRVGVALGPWGSPDSSASCRSNDIAMDSVRYLVCGATRSLDRPGRRETVILVVARTRFPLVGSKASSRTTISPGMSVGIGRVAVLAAADFRVTGGGKR